MEAEAVCRNLRHLRVPSRFFQLSNRSLSRNRRFLKGERVRTLGLNRPERPSVGFPYEQFPHAQSARLVFFRSYDLERQFENHRECRHAPADESHAGFPEDLKMVLGSRNDDHGFGVFRPFSLSGHYGHGNLLTGENQYRVLEQLRTGGQSERPHLFERRIRERSNGQCRIRANCWRRHEIRVRCRFLKILDRRKWKLVRFLGNFRRQSRFRNESGRHAFGCVRLGRVFQSVRRPIGNLQFLTMRRIGRRVRRGIALIFQLSGPRGIQGTLHREFPDAGNREPVAVFRYRDVFRQRFYAERRMTFLPTGHGLGKSPKRRRRELAVRYDPVTE